MLMDAWVAAHHYANPVSLGLLELALFMVPFFFIPVLVFVIGPDYLRRVIESTKPPRTNMAEVCRTIWRDRRSLWQDVYWPLFRRMLSWFASAAAGTLLYAVIHHAAG
jgi:hypothetical protein